MLKEQQQVEFTVDLPGFEITKGDKGIIVYAHKSFLGYEIKLLNSFELVTVTQNQIKECTND
jgi:hypothetical protein